MRIVLLAIVLLFTTPLWAAGSSVSHGMGGRFKDFDPIVAQYNRSGELFRIQGHCQSACTLFLAIRNVCIEPSARLLFNAGHDLNKNITVSSTNHMMSAYSGKLQAYLRAHHAMETLAFHAVSGADMIRKFGYRQCPK